MTFLEAIYGSQYYEIQQQGKDGNKGKFNGNVFLAVFVILFLIAVILICNRFSLGFENKFNSTLRFFFGENISGKFIGKILALPLLAIIYFVITVTVGSVKNFDKYANNFMQYPDQIKQKANIKY